MIYLLKFIIVFHKHRNTACCKYGGVFIAADSGFGSMVVYNVVRNKWYSLVTLQYFLTVDSFYQVRIFYIILSSVSADVFDIEAKYISIENGFLYHIAV